MISPAPIALFAYCRLDLLCRTVEALRQNELAAESDLFVFCDAAKTPAKEAAVREVREYVRRISGFKSVMIDEKEKNAGLANSVIAGVSGILQKYDRVIVVEDDIVTSRWFLRYMNDALEVYAGEKKLGAIGGYSPPVDTQLPETYFMPGIVCWGWATWRDRWADFNPDGAFLCRELKRRKLVRRFNTKGSFILSNFDIMKKQAKGKVDSWALRWDATNVLAGRFTLQPGRTLVENIGIGGERGTHCIVGTDLLSSPVTTGRVKVEYRVPADDRRVYRTLKRSYLRAHLDLLKNLVALKLRQLFGLRQN